MDMGRLFHPLDAATVKVLSPAWTRVIWIIDRGRLSDGHGEIIPPFGCS